MEFIHNRGFADPGVSGDEHQLWSATSNDAVKSGQKGIDLTVSPV